MSDELTPIPDQYSQLVSALDEHIAAQCGPLYIGDPQDRQYLASRLATWFLKRVEEESTQYRLLPKSTTRSAINVVDEDTGECIIHLSMEKQELSDEEFADMQNKFWTVIARHIRGSAETRKELEDCGIRVDPALEESA